MQVQAQRTLFETNWCSNLTFPKDWDPLLDGFPNLIKTQRLSIKPLRISSSEEVDWIERNILRDKRVSDGYLLVEKADPEQLVDFWLRQRGKNKDLHFTVYDSVSEDLLGLLDINILDPSCRKVSIGYAFSYDNWGKGYATETVDSVIALLFETGRIETIDATVKENNPKSANVLKKLGFKSYARCVYVEPVTNYLRSMPVFRLTRDCYAPISQAGGSWE